MSTFTEKACLGVTAPAFLNNKKSKVIDLLRLRQCRDSCCSRIFTDERAEEMINIGFATTDPGKTSTSKAAGVGAFPVRTEISDITATGFVVTLETWRGPIVNTIYPAKDEVTFEYTVNGGGLNTGAELRLKESPGVPVSLQDIKTIGGLSSGDVIAYETKLVLSTDPAVGVDMVLNEGTFTLP